MSNDQEPQNEIEPNNGTASVEPVRRSAWEWIVSFIPALDSLGHYRLRDFRADFFAGLTVAAVAVPQAMAYAIVAGLPPQYGLYTAIVMTAVGALLDSSKQLINGPTNAIAIALLSALAAIAPEQRIEAAILLALLVGLIQTSITLLRLGDLTRYVSHSVIVGFTLGAGIILVLEQIKHFWGVPKKPLGGNDHLLHLFTDALPDWGQVNRWTLGLGLGTIIAVIALRWFGKRLRIRLPEFLLVLIGSAMLVWWFGLAAREPRIVVGQIEGQLPGFQLPHIDPHQVRVLSGSALAIAVLGLLEAIAMAKAIAAQTGQKLDINQQCLSEGVANLVGSFFQCFPGSGSLTRSTINQQAGAVTQWSGVIAALAVAAIVLLFAPLAKFIPRATLAGILIVSAWRLVNREQLSYYLRATRYDAGIVLITALAAVVVSVEFCILIGVFLSFFLYVPRAARVDLTELTVTPERVIRERVPADPPCGRILIFNLEGELFFGSAPDLDNHLATIEKRAVAGIRVVVLRLKRARNPDAVCLDVIEKFLERMEKRSLPVLLCGVRLDLSKVLHSTGLEARLGSQRIFREEAGVGSSTLDAMRRAYDLLGGDVCATCPRRDEKEKEPLYYMI